MAVSPDGLPAHKKVLKNNENLVIDWIKKITTADADRFDLSALPGFGVSRASNRNGGTVNGTILTVSKDSDVSYSCDMGQGFSETFALAVIKKEPGAFSLPSGLRRIEDDAFRKSGISCFYLDSNVSHIGAYAFADLQKAAVIHMHAGDISLFD